LTEVECHPPRHAFVLSACAPLLPRETRPGQEKTTHQVQWKFEEFSRAAEPSSQPLQSNRHRTLSRSNPITLKNRHSSHIMHHAAMVISEHPQGLLHLADPARVSCETPVKKPSKSTRIFNGHVSKLAYTFLPHLPVFRVGSPVGSHFFYRISAFPGDSPAPPLESGSKRTHNIAANFPRSDSSGGAGEITGGWRRKVYANFETRPLKILVDFAYSR